MSTSAQIRSAWNTSIFSDVLVTAITTQALSYQYTEQSTAEVIPTRHNQEINFFTYLVTRTPKEQALGGLNYEYEVVVTYYRQKDVSGANYTVVNDVFETITGLVVSALGSTWGSTVDYSRLPETQPDVSDLEIAGRDCWQASQTYTAQKFILV